MKVEIKGLEKEKLNPKGFGGMCSRETVIFREENEIDFEKGINTVATTEAPAMVIDWNRWEIVREILPMKYVVLPKEDYAPLLDSHSRSSIDKVKGSTSEWKADGEELMCKSFISEAEPSIRQKIKEKSIRNVSIGYETYKEFTVEIPKNAKVNIDGVDYENKFEDEAPLLVRTKWKVKELSLVPLGADEAAQLRERLGIEPGIKAEDSDLQKLIDQAVKKHFDETNENTTEKSNNNLLNINQRGNTMLEKTPEQLRKEERERISSIEAIGKRFLNNYKGDINAAVKEAIDNDLSADQFRAKVFDNFDETKSVDTPATVIGMGKSDVENFSIAKAILAQATGDWSRAGLEREAIKTAQDSANSVEGFRGNGGLILPAEVIAKKFADVRNQEKALVVGTPSAGGYLVGTEQQNMLIPLLRSKTIAGKLGVKIISGLRQNISVPRQTVAGTFAWGAEAFNPSETQLTLAQMLMSPKEGKSSTRYSRKLLLQSIPSVDNIVNEDLLNVARIGLDTAVFKGAGGNAPTGLFNTSGTNPVVGASIDWGKVVEFETDISSNNADVDTMKFAMSPQARGVLKTREKSQGYPVYLMNDGVTLNGYGHEVSTILDAGDMAFGDWSRVYLGDWSLFELLVNPYKDESGDITVTVFVYADVAVSIPSAFSVADDVS